MVTTELHTDSRLGLTVGLYMGMMLLTVLLSVFFLVAANFWFAFNLLLSTELMCSWNYTLIFHSLVAVVSIRSSICIRNGNFFLVCIALYLSALNFTCQFIHSLLSHLRSLHHPSQSAFNLINLDTFVPSANVTWQLSLWRSSFMSMLNIGPSTQLCATPLVSSICSENDCLSLPSMSFISSNSFPGYFLLIFWLFSGLSSLWRWSFPAMFYLQGRLHLSAADPFRDNEGSLSDRTCLYTGNFDSFEVYPISSCINEFSTEC